MTKPYPDIHLGDLVRVLYLGHGGRRARFQGTCISLRHRGGLRLVLACGQPRIALVFSTASPRFLGAFRLGPPRPRPRRASHFL